MPTTTIMIGQRQVGPGHPCYIIGEAGVNHNGSLEMALKLVDAAARAGVDAVKFQTFRADQVVVAQAVKAEYQRRTTSPEESQLEMLRRLELPWADHGAILDHCRNSALEFLSSPFDCESASFLAGLGMRAVKISSGELTNLPLLAKVAELGLPLIVSTGMANLEEVHRAVAAIRTAGGREIIVLHCVSNYPAAAEDVNLRAMLTLGRDLGLPVGYSDHTMGIEVALAAAALGACVVEKHFTLDRSLPGPDHRASLDPTQLAEMVKGIRMVEKALGHGRKEPAASELPIAMLARRSLVAAQDIAAGETLTKGMVDILRPAGGMPPDRLSDVLGRRLRQPVARGTLLLEDMLD